jgi:hypothetical protein
VRLRQKGGLCCSVRPERVFFKVKGEEARPLEGGCGRLLGNS